ncbi:hypothetical protein FB451DRAFT_1391287 [Mycena latifolia]|nr:hypothetical protein FB451DRAFT_1391287 [Mycena latifolia]
MWIPWKALGSSRSAPPRHHPFPVFSNEIILEIFEHFSDVDLLSLATISKLIHELALLSYFRRYGITESDIASHSFPQLSTADAFRALRIARFITRVERLQLRFEPSARLDQHVRALADLSRRLLPIKSIDLEFCPWPGRAQMAAVYRCDMEGLLFTLISAYRVRPCIAVSPGTISVIRPTRSAVYSIRRLYAGMRAMGSRRDVRPTPLIEEQQFRQELLIFALMREGGTIPNVSIRAFDAPDALGSLIVLRPAGISDLRFPSTLRLSPAEMNALFARLELPCLRSVEAAQWRIAPAALRAFLVRHRSLKRLRLPGAAEPPPDPLPADALPALEHMLGSAQLLAWVLASPHPFPQLTGVTIELHDGAVTPAYYNAALRGIARRPALATLSLQLHGWLPWARTDANAPTAPEREIAQLANLRLTFRTQADVGSTLALPGDWLRLFRGLREVSLFDRVPLKNLGPLLAQECPHIKFTSYTLGR